MSVQILECHASKMANSDACPRPTTGACDKYVSFVINVQGDLMMAAGAALAAIAHARTKFGVPRV
jgi:hypothetical protein